MNKKVAVAFALVAVLIVIGLFMFGSKGTQPPQEPIPTSTPAPTEAPTPEPTATPEPTPEIVPTGEPGLHEDGSITFEDGHTLSADRAKGEFVPLDQVLTHIQINYGNDALASLSELVGKDKGYLEDIQSKLAKHTKEEMQNQWIPQYKEILETTIEVEKETEAAQGYNPNWAADNS